MVNSYVIKKKIKFPNQDELFEITKKSFNEKFPLDKEMNTIEIVKRYKDSSLPRDLNKIVSKGNGDTIMIGDAGFVLNRDFIKNVFHPYINPIKVDGKDKVVGIIGCKVMSKNYQIVDAGIYKPVATMPIWRHYDSKQFHPVINHEAYNVWIDGHFIIIRREVYNLVGPFDEKAGLYWAIDYCMQVHKKGYVVVYNPEEIGYWNYFEKDPIKLEEEYSDSRNYFDKKWNKVLVK